MHGELKEQLDTADLHDAHDGMREIRAADLRGVWRKDAREPRTGEERQGRGRKAWRRGCSVLAEGETGEEGDTMIIIIILSHSHFPSKHIERALQYPCEKLLYKF